MTPRHARSDAPGRRLPTWALVAVCGLAVLGGLVALDRWMDGRSDGAPREAAVEAVPERFADLGAEYADIDACFARNWRVLQAAANSPDMVQYVLNQDLPENDQWLGDVALITFGIVADEIAAGTPDSASQAMVKTSLMVSNGCIALHHDIYPSPATLSDEALLPVDEPPAGRPLDDRPAAEATTSTTSADTRRTDGDDDRRPADEPALILTDENIGPVFTGIHERDAMDQLLDLFGVPDETQFGQCAFDPSYTVAVARWGPLSVFSTDDTGVPIFVGWSMAEALDPGDSPSSALHLASGEGLGSSAEELVDAGVELTPLAEAPEFSYAEIDGVSVYVDSTRGAPYVSGMAAWVPCSEDGFNAALNE